MTMIGGQSKGMKDLELLIQGFKERLEAVIRDDAAIKVLERLLKIKEDPCFIDKLSSYKVSIQEDLEKAKLAKKALVGRLLVLKEDVEEKETQWSLDEVIIMLDFCLLTYDDLVVADDKVSVNLNDILDWLIETYKDEDLFLRLSDTLDLINRIIELYIYGLDGKIFNKVKEVIKIK